MNYLEELLLLEEDNGLSAGLISDNQTNYTLDASEEEPDLADLITERAIAATTPTMNQWLQQMNNWVEKGESLEDIRDRLSELYDKLDGEGFATQLMQQRMIADLGGRLEILEEIENGDNADTEQSS